MRSEVYGAPMPAPVASSSAPDASGELDGSGPAWRLDPRTKLVLLVGTCVAATFCRDPWWGSALFAAALALTAGVGRPRLAAKFLALYLFLLALVAGVTALDGGVGARFAIVFQPFRAALPPLMVAAMVVTTTKTGDLVAALYSLRLPHAVVIPLAVGIRFFPSLAEEWRYIRDAARLQGLRITPAGIARHPASLFESLFIPVMMRSAKIAEELAAAATARGIERPGGRTSFNDLLFARRDALVLAAYLAACTAIVAAWHVSRQGVML